MNYLYNRLPGRVFVIQGYVAGKRFKIYWTKKKQSTKQHIEYDPNYIYLGMSTYAHREETETRGI